MRPEKNTHSRLTLGDAPDLPGSGAASAEAGQAFCPKSWPKNYVAYAAFLFICLLTIIYFGVGATWRSQVHKEQARHALRAVGAGAKTVDMLMREKALTMDTLDRKAVDSDDRRLARAAANSAITEFRNLLSSSNCASCRHDEDSAAKIAPDLAAVREQVDYYLHIPGHNLPDQQINSINQAMARLTGAAQAIVANQLSAVWKTEVGAGDELALLTLTNELHQRSEQLRSSFVPALAAGRQLSNAEQLQIERTLARIEELHELIGTALLRRPDLQPLARLSVKSGLYLDGLQSIRALLAQLTQSAPLEMRVAELNRRYTPFISPITKFRNDLLQEFSARISEQESVLEIQLALLAVAAVALLLALIRAVAGFWALAIHPFDVANRIVRSFIQEDAATPPSPLRAYGGVTGELFEALTSLKEHIDFKRDLESQRDELIAALRKMAETDHLTGLLNRRAFERRVAEAISGWNDSEELLVFILFDVDHFKAVNDSFGHIAGDIALVAIAEICRENCRRTDIIARVGGEEFAVVGFANSAEEADELAHRLRLNIQNKTIVSTPGSFFHITASFGVAVSRYHEASNTNTLFGRADKLLYTAKSYGRNCVILSDEQAMT